MQRVAPFSISSFGKVKMMAEALATSSRKAGFGLRLSARANNWLLTLRLAQPSVICLACGCDREIRLAAVLPTPRPSIWLLSWAARSSQRSARAGEAPSVAMEMAASSVSAAARRVAPKPAAPKPEDPRPEDLSLEIDVASCCLVMDTPRATETRGRFMQGLPNRVNTCRDRIGDHGRTFAGD